MRASTTALDVIERLPARPRTIDRMVVGCAVILALLGIAVGAFTYQQRGSEAVRHAMVVDGLLGRVLLAIQDAETGQRGYLLTGDETFLRPFREGRAQVSREIARLHDHLRGDDSQRAELDALIPLIRDKLNERGTTIELRRSGDLVEVIARWNDKGDHDATVRIGIGLPCGEVFSGIIGEDARYEATVLGDTVNVAARLEQATKTHGVSMLASEAVRRAAGTTTAAWREISREPLRGRREPMAYYTFAPTSPAARQTGSGAQGSPATPMPAAS